MDADFGLPGKEEYREEKCREEEFRKKEYRIKYRKEYGIEYKKSIELPGTFSGTTTQQSDRLTERTIPGCRPVYICPTAGFRRQWAMQRKAQFQ
uniref:hypothetical protein n=1 Tax=Eisenbergiella sp. TaxID=1924109 RepID=UPI003AB1B760